MTLVNTENYFPTCDPWIWLIKVFILFSWLNYRWFDDWFLWNCWKRLAIKNPFLLRFFIDFEHLASIALLQKKLRDEKSWRVEIPNTYINNLIFLNFKMFPVEQSIILNSHMLKFGICVVMLFANLFNNEIFENM